MCLSFQWSQNQRAHPLPQTCAVTVCLDKWEYQIAIDDHWPLNWREGIFNVSKWISDLVSYPIVLLAFLQSSFISLPKFILVNLRRIKDQKSTISSQGSAICLFIQFLFFKGYKRQNKFLLLQVCIDFLCHDNETPMERDTNGLLNRLSAILDCQSPYRFS